MAVEYLGTGNDDGVVLGRSTADKVGMYNATPVDQGAALTAALTTITPADTEGTPDYAIAAITNSTAYGFASAQEAITVLYVIQNLQTRVNELEARLDASTGVGLIAAGS